MATHGGGLVRYDGAGFQALPPRRRSQHRLPHLAGRGSRRRPVGRHARRRPEPPRPGRTRTARHAVRPPAVSGHDRVPARPDRRLVDRHLRWRSGQPARRHTARLHDGRRPAEQCDHLGGRRRRGRVSGSAPTAAARSCSTRAASCERLGPEVVGSTLRMIEGSQGRGVVRRQRRSCATRTGSIRRIGTAEGLRSDEVRVIYAPADRTWVGTYGGGLQSIEARRPDRQLGRGRGADQRLRDVAAPRSATDTLWIGTYGGGLFRLRDDRICGHHDARRPARRRRSST